MMVVTFYSHDLDRTLEVESINLVQNTFVVRVNNVPTRLDGADKLIDGIRAEALRDAADRAVTHLGWNEPMYTDIADRLRTAILAGEVNE